MSDSIVIVSAARTPIGGMLGGDDDDGIGHDLLLLKDGSDVSWQ